MKNISLNSGIFLTSNSKPSADGNSIDKDVMLVYSGKFNSMDGEVEIKDKDIEKLAENHNALFSKLKRMAGVEEVHARHYPPIQLDHSTSARDTVGRLVGDLTVGDYDDSDDGKKKKALFGKMRVLGKENVEKVADGRWTHVSIGADMANHKISELTITPFPAAANAAMLKQGDEAKLKQRQGSGTWEGLQYEIYYEAPKGYWAEGLGEAKGQINKTYFDTHEDAETHARMELDGYLDMSSGNKKSTKLSEGEDMGYDKEKMSMYSKCKKHLMDKEQLSEEDADKKLAAMPEDDCKKMAAEHDENEKKMAAEDKEKEKLAAEETDKKKAEMTAAATAFTKLSSDFRASTEVARLAAKASTLSVKLAKLRAAGKITPAEIKKIKLTEWAKKPDAEIAGFISGVELRENVIHVGQMGSLKAETPAAIAARLKKVTASQLEQETINNMPMMKKMMESKENKARLASGAEDKMSEVPAGNEPPQQLSDEESMHLEKFYETMSQLMGEGKHDEAKEHLKKLYGMKKMASDAEEHMASNAEEHMSSLETEMKKMHTSFEALEKLVAPIISVTSH